VLPPPFDARKPDYTAGVEPSEGIWTALRPEDARRWLAGLSAPWWIAGGWALDLFVGRKTRAHQDLDVGCFRDDLPDVRRALTGWELHAARDGRLTRLAEGEFPDSAVHSLWCRPRGEAAWRLEILLDEREGDDWIFRRNRDVRMPIRELLTHDGSGLAYLRPEVQLLYKAKAPRPLDEEDFRTVAPLLGSDARAWLRDALARTHPGHQWLAALR
jgi:Aminoglycoside-2''-adenylyltransferase